MVSLSYKAIMWLIPDALFLIAVLVVNVGVIIAFVVTTVDVSDAEANIAMQRLYVSPNGISTYDPETGRVYPGIIDNTKFMDTQIENALVYPELALTARLRARTESESPPVPPESRRDAYHNKKKYEEWVVFAVVSDNIQGKGRVAYTERKEVIFENEPTNFETSVLMPR